MQIAIIAGPDLGTVFSIPADRSWTAGRGIDCDGVLNDLSCSRLQFEIRCEGGRPVLLDSGSCWGTTVNGQAVEHLLRVVVTQSQRADQRFSGEFQAVNEDRHEAKTLEAASTG